MCVCVCVHVRVRVRTDDRVGVKALQGHFKGVSCVDWSPVYKFIVSGSQDRRAILWNPFSLKPLATLSVSVTHIGAHTLARAAFTHTQRPMYAL